MTSWKAIGILEKHSIEYSTFDILQDAECKEVTAVSNPVALGQSMQHCEQASSIKSQLFGIVSRHNPCIPE